MARLRIVLPDQLDRSRIPSIAASGDTVLMAETGYLFAPTTHRRKLGLVTAAGRHYRDELARSGIRVEHRSIAGGAHRRSLSQHVDEAARTCRAEGLAALRPGSFEEAAQLETAAQGLNLALTIEEDPHFFSTPAGFAEHAAGRKTLVMEYFYRELRREHGVLMDGDEPAGGAWNFDSENRKSFGKEGPGDVPAPPVFYSDETTRAALADVEEAFPDAPGHGGGGLPVTPDEARVALDRFIEDRLARFGPYQDAIWKGEPFLYHSLLSPALNLKLLDPRELVSKAESAWRSGSVPLASAEGLIRQVLGWREFIRGVYYHQGADYLGRNDMGADHPLPSFFWDAKTRMHCVHEVVVSIQHHGYAHHIQRLMVMGLFAMLWGADPREVHDWHLASYLDAYDWVSAPNVLGMSQYADGGLVATKPYVASGKYIHRMSNYCARCPYNPDRATGPAACPFTTLYWDYLSRHRHRLARNHRMKLQIANLDRKTGAEAAAIASRVRELREMGGL